MLFRSTTGTGTGEGTGAVVFSTGGSSIGAGAGRSLPGTGSGVWGVSDACAGDSDASSAVCRPGSEASAAVVVRSVKNNVSIRSGLFAIAKRFGVDCLAIWISGNRPNKSRFCAIVRTRARTCVNFKAHPALHLA